MSERTTTWDSDTSLADRVYGEILDFISEGRWIAEDTVSAYSLARRLGVSRTPVVEALKRLEGEGLIEIAPRVGARLTRSTPEASEEVFAIVTALFGLAAERAAQSVDEPDLMRMEGLVESLAAAVASGDGPGSRQVGAQLYREVIRAGLPRHALAAERLWRLMRAEARRDIGVALRPGAVSEAQAVVDALRARSPIRARAAMERHIAALVAEARLPARARGADRPTRLEHAALPYHSKSEFIAAALPFVHGGIQQGEAVLVVSSEPNLDALGSALGRDGAHVDYRDVTAWYDDPASTLRRYRDYIDERAEGSRVRIVGEPIWTGLSEAATEEWLRYESVINVALESAPASIVCPYDVEKLPPDVVDRARAAHPHLCAADGLTVCSQYLPFFGTACL